jgi:hypothetical protein
VGGVSQEELRQILNVVSATGTLTGAGETAKAKEPKPSPVDAAKVTAKEYRKAILSQSVKLPSSVITKYVTVAFVVKRRSFANFTFPRTRPEIVWQERNARSFRHALQTEL